MRTDWFSLIGLGITVVATILWIGALADQAIKHQTVICQEGC